MKRFLSMLFVLCMCLSCFGGFAAYAEEGAQIKVSAVSGFAGEEVVVEVSIANNPGIAQANLLIGYDASVLVLKGSSNGSVMSGFVPSQTLEPNPYTLTWTQPGNSVVDGVLGTMTFEIKEGAALGASALSVAIVEVFDEDLLENLASSFSTVNGSVTVKEPTSTITSANVALGDTIAMNYYVDLYPGHAGAQMKFTMNEKEVLVDGVATGEPYEYRYTFTGITPQCMGDTILAELIYGGSEVASKEYSVLQNLQDLNGKTAVQLGYTDAKYAAMKTLIADLREYGAAAQVYTGHNINALVNDGNSGATAFVAPTETLKKVSAVEDEAIRFTSCGVRFDYNNAVFVKFVAEGYTAENFRLGVKVGSGEEQFYTLDQCELLSAEDSSYVFYLDPVTPLGFEDKCLVKVYEYSYDADFDAETFTTKQSLIYSVNSFVYSMYNNADVKVANLAKTLYNYGLSAEAFANSFNG